MANIENISFKEVSREEGSHGDAWNRVHGGYFSSPAVSAPYIAEIKKSVDAFSPDIIVDLGGGTGFILKQINKIPDTHHIQLINLDLSHEQLSSDCNSTIIPKQGSIDSFSRNYIDTQNKNFLFISRSTLHYAGQDGIGLFINNIRKQMNTGEFFIHQTACFKKEEDADLLNMIYRMMGTDKWYPTQRKMEAILEENNFEITDVREAPPLKLSSESLKIRYSLQEKQICEIRQAAIDTENCKPNLCHILTEGFDVFLHYSIFSCKAI